MLDETRAANFDDQVKFAWTGERHAYNVRDRKYLGEVTEAEVDLPSFHGRLLALLPYKVEALRIDAPSKAPAGKTLHLSAKIITDGNQPGEHVFRMEVFSPTGYRNLIYCRTKTAAAGEAHFQIPFANNDRRGQWTVLVRDVMTGVESKKTVELE